MNEKTFTINPQEARQIYAGASDKVKSLLEKKAGKDFFSSKVTDRIKTYEDACVELGEKPINEDELLQAGFTKDEITYRKLKTITKALNEGREFDIYDSDVRRWYPWFECNDSPSGFAFYDSNCGRSTADAGSGSRLCYKSEELANYSGKQFLDLWREFIQ
ncbi:hypothetical protein D0T49_03640 [Paludibacter sp. 221]|uniref:hypothetical protein n=1 Tax=Paludibacter sp. 221 TaxID=2302939 RepID=UPI0013D77335|nr:hypothetical protein [Paludibacter sp. 221]NDV46133.1 hypothetical protein [Paludibacter sp. 221]